MAAERGPGERREFQGELGQGQALALGIAPGARGVSPACGCVGPIAVVVRDWDLGIWGLGGLGGFGVWAEGLRGLGVGGF